MTSKQRRMDNAIELPGDFAFFAELEGIKVKHQGCTFKATKASAERISHVLLKNGYIVIQAKHMDAFKR